MIVILMFFFSKNEMNLKSFYNLIIIHDSQKMEFEITPPDSECQIETDVENYRFVGFDKLKSLLNKHKSKFDTFYEDNNGKDEWRFHSLTGAVDHFREYRTKLGWEYNAINPSNAFLKMYEIAAR